MTWIWCLVVSSGAWVAFAYIGYPAMLWFLARYSPRPIARGRIAPPISIIITVHNAADVLETKLTDTLALPYAGEKEIIVSSDASTDRTQEIAKKFSNQAVILIESDERVGKEGAQARAIERAKGEILIFTDGRSRLCTEALTRIVEPFADPSIGCVSSEDDLEMTGGEGAYVRFEMTLRRLETECTTLVGLSGSCFAARKTLCDHWPADLASDFRTALEASRRGLRAVAEPLATASFDTLDDPAREWKRKVRTMRRGLAVLSAYRHLLHPRYGRIAFSIWGHKVARFTSPFALILVWCASGIGGLADPLLRSLWVAQTAVYAGGLGALFVPALGRIFVFRVAGFFLLVNASMLQAWVYHLMGERAVTWTPTR